MSTNNCPTTPFETPEHFVAGGFSQPRSPTKEETQLLKNLWPDALNHCADLELGFDSSKLCSVRTQVVNGMNIEFLVLSQTHNQVRIVGHFPGPWMANEKPRVLSCEVIKQKS